MLSAIFRPGWAAALGDAEAVDVMVADAEDVDAATVVVVAAVDAVVTMPADAEDAVPLVDGAGVAAPAEGAELAPQACKSGVARASKPRDRNKARRVIIVLAPFVEGVASGGGRSGIARSATARGERAGTGPSSQRAALFQERQAGN